MHVIKQADEKRKKKHKNEILPVHPQELYLLGERTWTGVEPGNICSPINSVDEIDSSPPSWKSTSRQ